MLQWSRLLTRVRILVVFPADSNEGLGECKAPEDLFLSVVLSEDAVIFTSVRGDEGARTGFKSHFVGINELLSGICNFRLR